jgi:outer membrane lipoprotein-sorting protein
MNHWLRNLTILLFLLVASSTRGGRAPASHPVASEKVEALLDKLSAAKSIRLIGTFYAQSTTGKRVPCLFEYILERPNRYRATVNYCGCDDEKAVIYTVCDGKNYIVVNQGAKTATAGRANQLAAEFRVALMAQQRVPLKLGIGNPSTFAAAGRVKRDGIDCELYRSNETPTRHELWLDSDSSSVVASKNTFAVPGQPEKVEFETTSIEVDQPVPPGTFDVLPPAGFAVTSRDQTLADANCGPPMQMPDGGEVQCRFAVELNGGASVLLAWTAWDKARHEEDLGGPTGRVLTATAVSLDEKTNYSLYHVRDDVENGHHLRWSIALPALTPIEDRQMWLMTAPGKARVYALPLRRDREQIDRLLSTIQTSLAAPTEQVMTLEQFERLAKQLSLTTRTGK